MSVAVPRAPGVRNPLKSSIMSRALVCYCGIVQLVIENVANMPEKFGENNFVLLPKL